MAEDPTPEEIRERQAEVQSTWSPYVRNQRAGTNGRQSVRPVDHNRVPTLYVDLLEDLPAPPSVPRRPKMRYKRTR